MDAATARVTPEELDAIQTVTAPVPLHLFRLLPDCVGCQEFADQPVSRAENFRLRDHILSDHADLVIVSSD